MRVTILEAQIERELAQYEKDLSWVLENYDFLVKKYGNEFVGVLDERIIGHSPQIEELTKNLRATYASNYSRILIEFIYKEHPNFVLG